MRVRIEHEIHYAYDEQVRYWIQSLRMTPRGYDGQHVRRWRIEPSVDGRLMQREDALGNIVHQFSADAPGDALIIRISGEVETLDTRGFVRGTVERAPDLYYLRETERVPLDERIRAFAEEAAGTERGDRVALLHRLLGAIAAKLIFDPELQDGATDAAAALARGRGNAADLAHVFIGCARHLAIPARFVSGYLCRSEGEREPSAAHAWAEAKIGEGTWIGLDPASEICADEAHVRVAIGLDQLGAAPVRGSRVGGGEERTSVRTLVEDVEPRPRAQQGQSQSQA